MKNPSIEITPSNRDALSTKAAQLLAASRRYQDMAAKAQSEASLMHQMARRIQKAIKRYDHAKTNPDEARKGMDAPEKRSER